MQVEPDLVISYINNTKFYDHIRNNLNGNLSMQQLKQLVHGIESVLRYKPQTIICSFDQPVVVVVIYGQVVLNGSVYRKGDYFNVLSQQKTGDMSMSFIKSTTLVIFNSEVLYHRIQEIIKTREKMKIIQKCMPIKQLKFTLSQIRKIAKIVKIRQVKQRNKKMQKQEGIFLFFQGIFQIFNEQISFLQMENNFIQITSLLQFDISLKTLSGSYGYINREEFYNLLSPDTTLEMDKLYKAKQQLKNQYISKKNYLQQSQRIREKIKQKIRKSKKQSADKKTIQYQSQYKISLQTSRKAMLQKCSTAAITTDRSVSLSQSHKKLNSSRKNRSLTQVNWPVTFKSKAAINLKNISSRLDLMRQHSYKKSLTTHKFPKQWYYLDEDRMRQSLGLTYYEIRKTQKKSDHATQMSNYKRIHRIYSDPSFRKGLTFRSY